MAKPTPQDIVKLAGTYLLDHPEELLRALVGAFTLRFGAPLSAVRHLIAEKLTGKKAPQDVVIEDAGPGLRISATVSAMGTPLRASLVLYVEDVDLSPAQIRVVTRIAELKLDVLTDEMSPLSGLIKSGALDLSKPGNLLAFMPKRPDMIVDAKDDRITLDFLRIPALAKNERLRRALNVVTPVVGIGAIRVRDEHLDVHLKANLFGLRAAFEAASSRG